MKAVGFGNLTFWKMLISKIESAKSEVADLCEGIAVYYYFVRGIDLLT